MRAWMIGVGLFALTAGGADAQCLEAKLEKYQRGLAPKIEGHGLEVTGTFEMAAGTTLARVTVELQKKDAAGKWVKEKEPQEAVIWPADGKWAYNWAGVRPPGEYRVVCKPYRTDDKVKGGVSVKEKEVERIVPGKPA